MAEEENLMFKTHSALREVVRNLEKTESSPQGAEPCDALDRQLPLPYMDVSLYGIQLLSHNGNTSSGGEIDYWIIEDFQNTVNANPEVGVTSPLFSSMEIILVPTTSASGNMGVFVAHQGTNGPTCVNLSVALCNGRDVYLKRTPVSRWRHPNTPMGWKDFLPLDEVLRQYIRYDGELVLQFSFQFLK